MSRATDKTPLLDVRCLSIAFRMYDRQFVQHEVQTIRSLSARIYPGMMLAVVGASGSGKSLLAHAVMGLLPANASVAGEMEYCGRPLTPSLQAELCGKEIALVPQSVTCFDPLMRMGRQLCIRGVSAGDMRAAFGRYQLGSDVERLYPFQLSGGMARRALISTAIVANPRLVIADEPTPGLTEALAHETMRHFKELTVRGCSVMLITHDLDLALRYADEVTVFYEGATVGTVTPSALGDGAMEEVPPYCRALWNAMPQHDFVAVPRSEVRRMLGLQSGLAFARGSAGGDRAQTGEPAAGSRLEAKNVSFRYGGRSSPLILKDIGLRIEPGERVGLLGPSGYGKSTLGKLLAGYLTPTSGEVLLDGGALPKRGYSPVQLIHQHPEQALDPNRKVRFSLCEGWQPDSELLEALEIEEAWLNRWPIELSGGQLQRFCVARALGPQTRFLIADEISTMLDVITQAQIWSALLKVAERRRLGLLVITHNEALVKKICTRIVRFPQDGRDS